MKLTNPGTVPVYTIAGAETARQLPDWLARRRKRSLKNDPEYANRVTLLQEFEFEEASTCVRVSEDGDYIMSTGTYKPQIHVHYLPHLSLSFSRHTSSLNHTFVLLSSDYTKSLHLQTDRYLDFHTQGERHHTVRIPRFGRDLVYDRHSAEALVPAVGVDADGNGEVFRFNLELGRFLRSYQVDVGGDDGVDGGLQGSIDAGAVNTAAIAENTHGLLAFGTSISTVEFWDPRSKARVATLGGHDGEITALDFSPSGLSLATGSSTGKIQVYDMRSPVPLLTRDQGYGFPVHTLAHLHTASQEKKILSSDKRIVKIWDMDQDAGNLWTSIEPVVDINHVAWCRDSGMLLSANEGKQQHAWFIPQLGSAPRWCSFLDNMVEEMAEETHAETYDNYKFLTVPELQSLSLAHLVGKTNLLRPYMHGYFVASKLYEQARLIANPYVWEEERAKRVKEKVEKERATRIRGHKKVKVNQKVVDKLLRKQDNREKVDAEAGMLGDSRFAQMFEDEEFKVDERSKEFQLINPSTKVDEEEQPSKPKKSVSDSDAGDSADDESEEEEEEEAAAAPIRKRSNDMVMRVSSSAQKGGGRVRDTVLGSRVPSSARVSKQRSGNVVGEKSVTFVPQSRKKMEQQPQAPGANRRTDARRSASVNTLRKL